MIRNHLRTAVRNLLRHWFYSLINVVGLAIGIACCILVFLHVQDEFRYASYHSKGDRIYQVLRETRRSGSLPHISVGTSGGIRAAMLNDFPEVEVAVRVPVWQSWVWIRHGEKNLRSAFALADAEALEMFDIPLLRGNRATVLDGPGKIIIAEGAAEEYFGDDDPIGRSITVDNDKYGGDYTITGVFQDISRYSQIYTQFMTSHPLPECPDYVKGRSWQGWAPNTQWRPFRNFVQLREGVSKDELEAKLHDFMARYMGAEVASSNSYYLQPQNRIHLYSGVDYRGGGGPIVQIYLLSAIALLILLIACVNFVNLATAYAGTRTKEVGVRKVVGAQRTQLMRQFLCESIVLSAISFALALAIASLALPEVNAFVRKELSLGLGNNCLLYLTLAAGILFVGIPAGWYPAFFLSSFDPVSVLKGATTPRSTAAWLRKCLVIFQFAVSTALIISTIVVYQQTEFMRGRDLGWNKDYLINTPIFFANIPLMKQKERVKRAFLQHPNVLKVTAVWPPPGRGGERHVVFPEGKAEGEWEMQVIGIDEDFLDTYEIELVAGRNIDLSRGTDSTQAYILNETAVKALRWKDPIGMSFRWRKNPGHVIGVVRDFHTQPLHFPIEPVVMFHWTHPTLSMRIRSSGVQETLKSLEETWKGFIPSRPFEYSFQDEQTANSYWKEVREGQMYGTLSILAILVACLGLFGLASYTAERRTKEVGVRKSLGHRYPAYS